MALKGTLRDFSVADIFQLIAQQQKSGSLFVRTKEKEVHIVFDSGKVVLGTFRKSDNEFLLGTMLLRAGVITSDQLDQSIQNQKSTLRSLGDILISMKVITPAILGEFVQLQLSEVLFRLFQWKDGLYEFVSEQIKYSQTIIKPQAAEGVLMECFRMLDEWPAISRKVVSTENVFRSLVDPLDLTAETTQEKPEKEAGLSPEEKKILRLLDGHRSLQEVVYLSRLGTFDACRVTATLMDRGLALKLDQASMTRIEPKFAGAQTESLGRWLGWSYRFLLAVFALSLVLPVIAFGLRSYWASQFDVLNPATGKVHREEVSLLVLKHDSNRRVLQNILELSRLESGSYPRSLQGLASSELTSKWEYRRKGESYTLVSHGSKNE